MQFTPAKSKVVREIEQRLAKRRLVEAELNTGPDGTGSGFSRDRMVAALLKTGLQATGLYGRGRANTLRPVVRHLRLHFPHLPAALDGFRILHLTDFHIDGVDGLAEVAARELAFLSVDLCVLTGDYRFDVYGSCDEVYPRMEQVLAAVRSRHGIVGILGNHDCADIAVELEAMGVRMLINESERICVSGGHLSIIGTDDSYDYECDDLPGAMNHVPPQDFKLLLAHTPEMFHRASLAGIDLYLTGHTHAGQIRLPGIGSLITNAECPREYTYGLWKHGRMQGYTSAGVGCSLLPVRFGCPPEIVVVELAKR